MPRDSNNNIVYTEVIKFDSVSADALYSRAKIFVADYYKISKDVTQLNDDASKTVVIKPVFDIKIQGLINSVYSGYTHYQLKIECKENRYRYRVDGFVHDIELGGTMNASTLSTDLSGPRPRQIGKSGWVMIHDQVEMKMHFLVMALKKAMETNSSDF